MFGSLYCSPILRSPRNKLVPATTTNWGTGRRDEGEQDRKGWKERERGGGEGGRNIEKCRRIGRRTYEMSDVEEGKVMR